MNKNSTEPTIYSRDTYQLEPPERYGSVSLVQLADITARLGWEVKTHVQFCHEIIIILEGEAMMAYNDQRFNIQVGQMVIVPEGILHDVRYVSPVHTRMLLIGFRLSEEPDPWLHSFFVSTALAEGMKLRRYPQNLRVLFDMLIDEYFNQKDHPQQVLASLISLLLVQCCRQYQDAPREPANSLTVDVTTDLLTSQMCKYIREHAAEMTSLEELSREFSYTYSYLSHHFKRTAGYSIKEYWDHYRFEHVLQLMRDPSLSITEIAERVHFQSIHTFSRSFRTRFGMAPTEFRKMLTD